MNGSANKDEAEKCLLIAERKRNEGNYEGAIKFIKKSIALYETEKAVELLRKVENEKKFATGTSQGKTTAHEHTNGSATQRVKEENVDSSGHSQGRQNRSYTPEQASSVRRIMACHETDFYAMLEVKKTCSQEEVKKAYRKLALKMHPDKNGAPDADEAFKRISKAFGVLGDEQRRGQFDATGSDPTPTASGMPRGGFGRTPDFSRFEGEDLSPEDIFNFMFGGGQFGGFGGSGFGPGVRTYRFGGPSVAEQFRPRRQQQQQQAASGFPLIQLLPIFLLFLFTFGGSLFDVFTTPNPGFTWSVHGRYNTLRHTPNYKVPYFVNKNEWTKWNPSPTKLRTFEVSVESQFRRALYTECEREMSHRQFLINDAIGWFSTDREKLEAAQKTPLPSCQKYQEYGFR